MTLKYSSHLIVQDCYSVNPPKGKSTIRYKKIRHRLSHTQCTAHSILRSVTATQALQAATHCMQLQKGK